ncbi:sensor histidine kinase [Vacuolonema iberomarrocanum]|uniref:sensor histidine kinase n=1 Tax=Vacuolonema iberomarrocanum TaxID=3454632 RepID=UPI0019D87AAE|nr:HAMP domain-containing histidine kinase [filamentous cyanobacterium LEGE 07170]
MPLLTRHVFQPIYQRWASVQKALFPAESADYIQWRHEFLHKRLGFGLWVGLICFLISSAHSLNLLLFHLDRLRADLDSLYGEPWLADQFREITIIGFFLTTSVIVLCLVLHKTYWGHQHPAWIFIIFASAVDGFLQQLIATFYGLPISPSTIVFLALAVLLPLRWPLHLLIQLLPITYYVIVLPIFGLTEIGDQSTFDVYGLGTLIEIGWVCLISNVAVFVYERMRRSEFESRRELQIFLHAISHDLSSPVMGTSVVLRKLLDKSVDGQVTVGASVVERLVQGSDRQLSLLNSLVEAYNADGQGISLRVQPLQLSSVVQAVVADSEPKLHQNTVELRDVIDPELPYVSADPTHLWRIFSNLIDNALKHNPPGIQLILDAEVIDSNPYSAQSATYRSPTERLKAMFLGQGSAHSSKGPPMILCRVQDSGIGIPPSQCQRLFDLYTRGKSARYMPGLGLGLYLCKQIVTAHGGEIGVVSQPGKGTTFWFTLPLATSLG